MGRELKRKQAKKEGKNLKKELYDMNTNNDNQIYKFVKMMITLVIIFAVLYIVVGIFITKEIDFSGNKDNEVTDSVSNKILASSIFNQKEEEYYVYFYDFENMNNTIESTLTSKLKDAKIYRVNTKDALNQNYVTEESGNKSAKTLEDLKVVDNTLIKIVNNEIVSYYETEDEIVNGLE